MKINLSRDGELAAEATDFKEARALSILYQRIVAMRSASEDYMAWADEIFLEDTGSTLALIWRPSKEEADQ